MTEPKVETIQEASEAIAKAKKTTTVELADGTEVVVRKLSWMRFTDLWERLGKMVVSWLQLQSGETLSPEEVAAAIMEVPGLAVEFVASTTDYTENEVRKFDDYADVCKLVAESVMHNWPGEVLGFFAAIADRSGNDQNA